MKKYKTTIPKISLVMESTEIKRVKITCSRDSADYIREHMYKDDIEIYESMFLLLLNRANNTIGFVKISQGGLNSTTVDTRLIAKYAVESLCSGIILCHNHPSGNNKPSASDKYVTDKVAQAMKIFDIGFLDHIILSKDSFYSMADEGEM